MTTIGLHVLDQTRMRVRPVSCHRVTVLFGDRTELALFLDVAAIDRLDALLEEARALLYGPPRIAA